LTSHPPVLLELTPSLHCDLGAIKLALIFDTCLLGFFTGSLSSISPGEIIEFPESVSWEDEVPNRKREQIDKHPYNIRPSVGGKDDENSGKTENQG
jgi:hypothetical protein